MSLSYIVDRIGKSNLFDTNWYLYQIDGVIDGKIDEMIDGKICGVIDKIIKHYVEQGSDKGLNPSSIFNTYEYLEMYPDVKKSRMNPFFHWIEYGIAETRMPSKQIMFNSHNYLKHYPQYKLKVNDAFCHYVYNELHINLNNKIEYFWKSQSCQIVKDYPTDKDILIMLSHAGGGGLCQYVENIIKISIDNQIHKKFDIFTNMIVYYPEVKYMNHQILKQIMNLEPGGRKIILHINILPEPHKLQYNNVENFVNALIMKPYITLIVTVHDFYWLKQNNPNIVYSAFEKTQTTYHMCQKLFERANLVIFPSNMLQHRFAEKNVNFDNINYIVQPHCDVYYNDIEPYYPMIENHTIKILYIGVFCEHKGFNLLINILKLFSKYQHPYEGSRYNIQLYLLGYNPLSTENNVYTIPGIEIINLGKYNNKNVFKLINMIKPNIITLMSIAEETWSYTLSIVLKTGLPIFYNNIGAYKERINNEQRKNAICFNSVTDPINKIAKQLEKLCQMIVENQTTQYIEIDPEYKICTKSFYEKLYTRESYDFKIMIDTIDCHLDTLYDDNKAIYDTINEK